MNETNYIDAIPLVLSSLALAISVTSLIARNRYYKTITTPYLKVENLDADPIRKMSVNAVNLPLIITKETCYIKNGTSIIEKIEHENKRRLIVPGNQINYHLYFTDFAPKNGLTREIRMEYRPLNANLVTKIIPFKYVSISHLKYTDKHKMWELKSERITRANDLYVDC